MKYILASKSPRRREILASLGLEFEVIPAVGEETITDTDPVKVVESLAAQKAREVADRIVPGKEDALVVGSDTVVVQDGGIFGKPRDTEDAFRMLRRLQGRGHSVHTGVALIRLSGDGRREEVIFSEETEVYFYPMSDEEIRAYILTGEPADKAGGYGIQGKARVYIRGIKGDYLNVVGLPAARLYQELRKKAWL